MTLLPLGPPYIPANSLHPAFIRRPDHEAAETMVGIVTDRTTATQAITTPRSAAVEAQTMALQRVLNGMSDPASKADLLFLEKWERDPLPGAAAALRIAQLRRANPDLAAEIRAELACGRPLTAGERAALASPMTWTARPQIS